ncbi:MAG: hypothetical protein QXK93_08560 [Candidatus Bathyarchaeia archaeon]
MSERPHAHMIYIPAELYIGLFKKVAALEIGESAAILDCINEALYNEGFIDDVTYQRFRERYRKKLVEVVREKEGPSVKVEISAAKLKVHKRTAEIKSVDYSRFTDDELLEVYRKAILSNDVVTPNLIQGEAKRRGYRLRADEFGNIRVVSLK